jgi:hypothetical protein
MQIGQLTSYGTQNGYTSGDICIDFVIYICGYWVIFDRQKKEGIIKYNNFIIFSHPFCYMSLQLALLAPVIINAISWVNFGQRRRHADFLYALKLNFLSNRPAMIDICASIVPIFPSTQSRSFFDQINRRMCGMFYCALDP